MCNYESALISWFKVKLKWRSKFRLCTIIVCALRNHDNNISFKPIYIWLWKKQTIIIYPDIDYSKLYKKKNKTHNVKFMLRRFEKRTYFRGKTINTRFLHVSNGKEIITRYYKKDRSFEATDSCRVKNKSNRKHVFLQQFKQL